MREHRQQGEQVAGRAEAQFLTTGTLRPEPDHVDGHAAISVMQG